MKRLHVQTMTLRCPINDSLNAFKYTYYFDTSGQITKSDMGFGISYYTYDKKGNMVKQVQVQNFDTNTRFAWESGYTKQKNDSMLKIQTADSGRRIHVRNYDELNRLLYYEIQQYGKTESKYVYIYEPGKANYKCIRENNFYKKFTDSSWHEVDSVNHLISEERTYLKWHYITGKTTYTYNEKQQLIEQNDYDYDYYGNALLQLKQAYTYHENGEIKSYSYTPYHTDRRYRQKPDRSSITEYDENGLIIRESTGIFIKKKERIAHYTYTYYENGLVKTQTTIETEKGLMPTTYQYTYTYRE
ncbi:MAG TPA: hypothetical protein VK177_00890 [Flavobacteriales bacterium]|nr:hypothetical protein [Flavobacteriales bacterium]